MYHDLSTTVALALWSLIIDLHHQSSEATINKEQMSEEDQSAGELQSIVWGWQAFFDRLSHFLLSVDLRTGVASKNYVVYAMERLETCLMNMRFLRQRLVSVRDKTLN